MENKIIEEAKVVVVLISILSTIHKDNSAWLNVLHGIRENLEDYMSTVEDSLKNIVEKLNNLSEEDRAKFITKDQMAVISEFTK
jgi:hypothetical protein